MTHVVGIKKAGASSLVLAVCLGAFFLWPHATPAHAYTVDGVINGVRHHPEAWIRTYYPCKGLCAGTGGQWMLTQSTPTYRYIAVSAQMP